MRPSAAGQIVYRPISGLALAGFSIAALFTGIVLVSALVSLWKAMPIFLSDWFLMLAVAGAALSYLGQRQIASSEGTRAGRRLTRWGIWLSVFLGLGYFAFVFFTGLALASQADDFLRVRTDGDSGFFPRLQNAAKNQADLHAAFLLSLPAPQRAGSDPGSLARMRQQFDQAGASDKPGPLTVFRGSQAIIALVQAGAEAQVQPAGAAAWDFDNGSYKVTRSYRLTMPEATLDLAVSVRSFEGAAGEKRTWFVDVVSTRVLASRLTPQGEVLRDLRKQAHQQVTQWIRRLLRSGEPFLAYQTQDTDWSGLIRQEEVRKAVQDRINLLFLSGAVPGKELELQSSFNDGFTPYRQIAGGLQLILPLECTLPVGRHDVKLDGEVTVISRAAVDLDSPNPGPQSWDIVAVSFTSSQIRQAKQPQK